MWDAVHELIAASFHDPTVLVFEDLHWADPSSIALLREIVERHSARLMIVFTSRPDAKRTEGWLHELTDTGDSVLHLERLDRRDVRGLINAVLTTYDEQSNLPERLTEKADGNPFYLVSFLRSLVDDGRGTLQDGRIEVLGSVVDLHIPDSLHAVVAARIDRLANDSKHYLRLASVVGRTFAHTVLKQLAEAESPALDTGLALADLMDRQLIERQPGETVQFVHAVVHEVAYEGMLASERRRLHRLTARLLTSDTDAESERSLATLAWHREHAGDQREASNLYERAAAVALRSHANDEALSYFASAIRLADAGDGARTMLLREQKADLHQRAGQYDTAQSDYRSLLDDLDDDRIETRCRLFRKQARCLLPQHRYGEATVTLGGARIALQGREAGARDGSWWHEHFELSLDSMWALYLAGDPTEFATKVSEMSTDFGSSASATQRGRLDRIRALLELRQHRFRVGPPTVERANKAVEQLFTSGDESELCFAMFTHAFTLLWSDEHARAEDGFHAALLVAERIGDAERTLMSLTYLALAARFRNDPATAEAFALAARSAAGKSPIYSGVAIANLSWLAWRNQEQQAAELFESARRLLMPFPTYPFHWINAIVGLALVLERTPPDLAAAAELATVMMSPLQQLLHPDLQEALAAAVEQPPETALDAYRNVVATARSTGYL